MKNKIVLLLAFVVIFIFTGCGPKISTVTKKDFYASVYANQPKSILVLPAKNTTTSVDATRHFSFTITKPLAEKGYYVFPPHLVDDFFKGENLSDAELIHNIPIENLKKVFNADAILYVDINAWDTGYSVVSSNVDVGLTFSLVDGKTGQEIWNSNAYAYSYDAMNFGSVLDIVVSAISTAVNTGVDYTSLANLANSAGVAPLPYGFYSPQFQKDYDEAIQFADMSELEDGRLYVDKYFILGEEKQEKVPLTIRHHLKGYHALNVNNLGSNIFQHNGYANYYITQKINGKTFLRNRFFNYENNRPYIIVDNKKAFVFTEPDGKIPYNVDDSVFSKKYYFNVTDVVEIEQL